MLNLEQYIRSNNEELINIHWDNTINDYVKKLSASKVLFKKLAEREYFKSTGSSLENLFFKEIDNEISRYISDAKNPIYQIAIVGAIKSGKSTLINALIGYDLVSTNVTPETATLTKIRKTEKNSIMVKFYTRKEWEAIWKDVEKSSNATIFKEEFEKLRAKEIENQMLGRSDVFYKFDDLETMKEEIKKFTSSHAKQHYFVKEIEIGLENLNLPDQVCLVDTPGLNDPVQYRSNITTDYIHSANAVIICVNAKTLRNDEIVTILDVLAKAQNKKDKVYVLGTQIDIMNSQADWEQQQKEWLKHLKEKQFYGSLEMAKKQLIGISSYFYSNAIKLDFLSTNEIKKILFETATKGIITQDETLSLLKLETFSNSEIEKIKRKIINYSNIESIQYLIFNTLIMGFNENLKNDFINKYGYLASKIQVFKNEHMKKIFTNISRFEQDESILKQQILENTRQKEEQENLTKILKTKIQETTKVFNTDFSELNKNFKDFMDKIKKIKFED